MAVPAAGSAGHVSNITSKMVISATNANPQANKTSAKTRAISRQSFIRKRIPSDMTSSYPTAAASRSLRAWAAEVSRDSVIRTLHWPSAGAVNSQCGITALDWCTASKPPSDWLIV